jgi:hypothetical protein
MSRQERGMIDMCFNRKYKQRIQELEGLVVEQANQLLDDEAVIDSLIKDIESLNKEVETLRRRLRDKENGKYSLYLLKENGYKWFEEAYSVDELIKATGISRATLMSSLQKGEPLKGSKNAKYDSKYVGSQVVDANEWYERQS